jgi:hypothetical protein
MISALRKLATPSLIFLIATLALLTIETLLEIHIVDVANYNCTHSACISADDYAHIPLWLSVAPPITSLVGAAICINAAKNKLGNPSLVKRTAFTLMLGLGLLWLQDSVAFALSIFTTDTTIP